MIFDSSGISLSGSELIISVSLSANFAVLLFLDGLSLLPSWLVSSYTVLQFRILGVVFAISSEGSAYSRLCLNFPLKSLTYFISLGVSFSQISDGTEKNPRSVLYEFKSISLDKTGGARSYPVVLYTFMVDDLLWYLSLVSLRSLDLTISIHSSIGSLPSWQ